MRIRVFQALAISLAILLSLAGHGMRSYGADAGPLTRKPVIAINTSVSGEKPEESCVESTYIEAIRKAGGIPVLLPPMPPEDLASLLPWIDGVLMIGGADYPPALYHQDALPSISLMKDSRTNFDIALAKAVLAEKALPCLGICAGCQVLNIAAGGSLTQDIPSMKPESKVKHSSSNGWKNGFNRHQVEIVKGSQLAHVFGRTEMNVVTSHHQCVDAPGRNLIITARSVDGLPEAIEVEGGCFVVGVQWHPERDLAANQKLFEALVSQAALRQAERSHQPSGSLSR